MSKYFLYGAAVQGIQSFIFQTNKLKDIVGASDLVKRICKEEFAKLVYGKSVNLKENDVWVLKEDPNSILSAAGNIKYIFEDEEKCKKVVREFPKKVLELAPGITISQAVVSYDNEDGFAHAIDDLEKKLKAQRNRPVQSLTLGLMGIPRSRKTGLPAVEKEGDDFLDAGTKAKRDCLKKMELDPEEKYFGIEGLSINDVAVDLDKMTEKNDWIAVVHIDGNGLGEVVQKIGRDKKNFKEFSEKLDESTITAASKAYGKTIASLKFEKGVPYRPIVLGGDDHTFICRADLAVEYTRVFLKNFEEQTKSKLSEILEKGECGFNHLTACAGIAFVKSSYPFYYACDLAETLCLEAKKDARKDKHRIYKTSDFKGLAPSCLLFHKVQDSFVEDFEDIRDRELTPSKETSFFFGPYYLNKETLPASRWTIRELQDKVEIISKEGKEGNVVKSHLRQWMSLLHRNPEAAKQQIERVISMLTNKGLRVLVKELTQDKIYAPDKNKKKEISKQVNYYPVYDLMGLYSIKHQKTK